MVPNLFRRATGFVRTTSTALRSDGRGWILISVAMGWLLVLGLRFAIPTLLPQIKAEFTISDTAAGIAITLIWGTYGLMQFPAGILVDRFGSRRLLTGSLLATCLSMVSFAIAPVFGLFLVACVLFGVSTGFFGPPRSIVLSNTYTKHDGTAFGATLAAGSIGAALIPLAIGVAVTQVEWRTIFWLLAPLGGVLAIGMWRFIPEFDRTEGPIDGTTIETVRKIIGVLRRPIVVIMFIATALMLFVLQGLTAFLPTYFIEMKDLSQGTAAGLYSLLFVCGAVFQSTAGTAADRFGDKRVLVFIAGVSVIPLVALPFTDGFLPLALLTALLGIRLAVMPVSNAYIVRMLPAEIQGTVWGLIRSLFFGLGAFGSVFVGTFADANLFDEAFLILAGFTAVGTLLYLLLPSPTS